MACSGLVFPKKSGGLLDVFNLMGCEKIHQIDGILTKEGNNNGKVLKERIENTTDNEIKDF